MKKLVKTLSVLAVVSIGLAEPAHADGRVDAITQQLSDQGFGQIKVSRTFLGRVRVEALREGREREIIFNPRTGEILRDYWDENSTGSGGWLLGGGIREEDDREDRAGNRRGREEDDRDDDHDDADDED